MDINEPVYMRCSGQKYFYNAKVASDYEHQNPETGRWDCRYQANAAFGGAPEGYVYTGPVWCYLKFPVDGVTVDRVNDWGRVTQWDDGGHTYWIGKINSYTLQNGNNIGLGDLIAHMTYTASDDVPEPEITFSFGYDGSSCI